MKKVFTLIFCLIVLTTFIAKAQLNSYFVGRGTINTYNSIELTGISPRSTVGWNVSLSGDDQMTNKISFPGWTFNFDGAQQSAILISSNGFITFDTTTTNITGGGSNVYGYINSDFSSGTSGRSLAPLYDDLRCSGQNSASLSKVDSCFKYQFDGGAGNHVLTIEWYSMTHYADISANLNFQIKLYENSSCIVFIYGIMNGGTASFSYTCGINSMDTPYVSTSQLYTQQMENTNNFGSTPQNNLGTVPDSFSFISFCPTDLGIMNLKTNKISIFPNPATNTLNIHSQLSILNSQLLIEDVLGNKIYHQTLSGTDNSIDVSKWSEGVYFYEIISNGEIARGKFIVQK